MYYKEKKIHTFYFLARKVDFRVGKVLRVMELTEVEFSKKL